MLGASTSWRPMGLSRPVIGWLYLHRFVLKFLCRKCLSVRHSKQLNTERDDKVVCEREKGKCSHASTGLRETQQGKRCIAGIHETCLLRACTVCWRARRSSEASDVQFYTRDPHFVCCASYPFDNLDGSASEPCLFTSITHNVF